MKGSKMLSLWIFAVLSVSVIKALPTSSEEKDLVLVHAIFRHGERGIEEEYIYPKDPHANKTYYPYGLGQLTNKGKLREYNLGQTLRLRYNDFLGSLYTPLILDAWSTDHNRTKMSLELVLAGLFPPSNELQWNPLLNWQPIPYNYSPKYKDKVLNGLLCPNFDRYYFDYLKTPKIQRMFQENREIMRYISIHSGWNVTNYFFAHKIYGTLLCEAEWGFKLPEWSARVYPVPLRTYATEEYRIRTGTLTLRRFTAGYFLQKLVEDTQAKIDGTIIPKDRKLFLYSAHDRNIAFILATLDIFKPHVPPYGSCLMFEISKKNNRYGIEIYYLDNNPSKPTLLKLSDCETFCLWDKFVAIVEKYFPPQDLCG